MDGERHQSHPKLEEVRRLAESAHCKVYHTPGEHIVIVENYYSSESDISEYGVFCRSFPDNDKGYIAARSAIIRRFPQVGASTMVCAKCGEEKPLSAFDKRFWGKAARANCEDCRNNVHIFQQREREQLELMRSDYQARYPNHAPRFRYCGSVAALDELAKELDERAKTRENEKILVTEWRTNCRNLGFSEREQVAIANIHLALRRNGEETMEDTWANLRQRFLALTPPYLGGVRRRKSRLTPPQEVAMYEAQSGMCAYCGCELLPLSYRKIQGRHVYAGTLPDFNGETSPDTIVTVDVGCAPEVEHRTPVARGGDNEPDNLVFACRACNDAKEVRTEDEFRAMPNDAISLLGIHPAMLLSALDYERRGYRLFGDERYRRLAWRMRYPGE